MVSTPRTNLKNGGSYARITQQTENGASSSSEQKPWRPLTQTVNIPAAILAPYRYNYFFLIVFLSPLLVQMNFFGSHFIIDVSMKYFYMIIVLKILLNLVGVSNNIQIEFGFMF